MLTNLGSLTIGQCVPLLAAASGHLDASIVIGSRASAELSLKIGPVLASLNAKLASAIKLQTSLTVTPPSLTAQLDAAQKLVVALQAAISLGLPGVSFQLAAVAKLIASIQADLAALALDVDYAALLAIEVDFAADLAIVLGTPGLHAYAYTGAVSDLGDELAAATETGFPGGRGSDSCAAVVFAASDGGAIEAMRVAFAVAA
jgi:hypothetical protein